MNIYIQFCNGKLKKADEGHIHKRRVEKAPRTKSLKNHNWSHIFICKFILDTGLFFCTFLFYSILAFLFWSNQMLQSSFWGKFELKQWFLIFRIDSANFWYINMDTFTESTLVGISKKALLVQG